MNSSRNPERAGFALIASISIMAVLVMIAVTLYSLSNVATRSAAIATAKTQAQANAKMALMQAIGEVQKLAGPDTRITAPADIIDNENPTLVGVWRSWEGSDHITSGAVAGLPIAPDYSSKNTSEDNGGRFIGWLVSGASEQLSDPNQSSSLASKTETADTIPLLSEGTLGPDSDKEVHVVPRDVDGKGKYAWWASAENQKARLPKPLDSNDPNYPNSAVEWSSFTKTNTTADPEPFGLNGLFEEPTKADKVATRETMDLLGSDDDIGEYFHDLTPYSTGLLTNVATGGWKKDLSLFTERGDHNSIDLPLFQVLPGQSIDYNWPTSSNPTPSESMLYPWSEYRTSGSVASRKTGAVSSWANFQHWATHYKRTTSVGDGVFSTPVIFPHGGNPKNSSTASEVLEFLHTARMFPIIARIQWVFSYDAVLDPNPPSTPSGPSGADHYYPRILMTPVITLWNPYNVSVTVPDDYSIYINETFPAALKFVFDNVENSTFHSITRVTSSGGYQSPYPPLRGGRVGSSGPTNPSAELYKVRNLLGGPYEFAPGETLIFSPADGFEGYGPNSNHWIHPPNKQRFEPGVRLDAGWFLRMETIDSTGNRQWRSYPASTEISALARFDNLNSFNGVGINLVAIWGSNWISTNEIAFSQSIANDLNPPMDQTNDLASVQISSAADSPQPFLSLSYGPRTANLKASTPAKGFVQTNPFNQNILAGIRANTVTGEDYPGVEHPVNIQYGMSYIAHATGGGTDLPNETADGNGFIFGGASSSNGLKRGIIAELPIEPIASLAELTNWDMRLENPVPPFGFNLIGNSDATPLIPSDSVVRPGAPSPESNLQHDDSYCANHLLFDDWFVSSIAPDPADTRDQEDVYTDFLEGEEPLQNRAYKPIPKDLKEAESGDASDLYDELVDNEDDWQTISSRLIVEGMFNVNSTSETAWRALLGHARNIEVPHFTAIESIGTSSPTDYAFSRFPIAGDSAVGTPGISGGNPPIPEATDFAGYRVYDDGFLDSLAEKIVEQVRERGPFLSLAEFVNRQLSSGDLALAGAIQTALNEVAEEQDTFASLQLLDFAKESLKDPEGEEEYEYPEAAEGYSSYGMPGWTRQADVLRPIAPILTARDDTFTIRAYGDVRDQKGEITSRAYCEAVIQRTREYLDKTNPAETALPQLLPINSEYGRRFEIISFRWLEPEEV